MMRKTIVVLGIASVSVCISAAGLEAKLIRYEINGQQYSYSTNNRQQTREARERIEAARAADAAKGRADAESAANPLARLFGSPAQRDAIAAQTRARQIVPAAQSSTTPDAVTTDAQSEVGATSSVRRSRAARRRSVAPAHAARQQPRAVRQAHLGRPGKIDTEREQKTENPRAARENGLGTSAERAATIVEPVKPILEPVKPIPAPAVAATAPAPVATAPAPSVDVRRADAAGEPGSLSDFVNQVRKAPPEGAPRL